MACSNGIHRQRAGETAGFSVIRTSICSKRPLQMILLLLLLLVSVAVAQDIPQNNLPRAAPMFSASSSEQGRGGTIEDAHCTVEDLEQANDSQLYTILQELRQTVFFRNFVVDLEEPCPLKTVKTTTTTIRTKETKKDNDVAAATTNGDDTEQCASDGLPDMDDESGAACTVKDDTPFSNTGIGQSAFSSSSPSIKKGDAKDNNKQAAASKQPYAEEATVKETKSSDVDDNDDDSFECNGGDDLDMDEDAEALCDLEQEKLTPIQDLIASALQMIRSLGWESESQKQTYTWKQQTDIVRSPKSEDEQDCGNPMLDSFWQDMCSNIKEGKATKVVNLVLNPERNTGYNGTHIWKAIYQENCIMSEQDMCYEERVLYRLLSGLHTSTTLSIAKHYYPPSKKKNRTDWESNPDYFMEKFHEHPEYLRNLHFSYVVLLRALRKASDYLYNYEIRTGDIVEDETATILLRRLLDTAILRSCQPVFSAFDETLMFSENAEEHAISLKQNFKGVFHNVSSILDCVQCQQCKVYGKMAMLGYGTALKILFMKEGVSSLDRNEIVAFINTIVKFSEGMTEVRELTHLYWQKHQQGVKASDEAHSPVLFDLSSQDMTHSTVPVTDPAYADELVDKAVGTAASLARGGHINAEREMELVQLALQRNSDLLVLVKHYSHDLTKFLEFSNMLGLLSGSDNDEPDAIVVGSGLAGLAATLNLLDRGGKVIVVEKEHRLGGNSNKASSGINACCPQNETYGDFLESFRNDTIRSAGAGARPELIDVLVSKSADAIAFLKERAGVDLSLLAQLGGHAHKRTHRPSNGMVGAEIIYGMQKAVRAYEKTGKVKIMVDTRVTRLLTDQSGRVIGIEAQGLKDDTAQEIRAPNVVLATGGFASDRSSGSYLDQYRPELMNMPATAGSFSTGDGIALGTALGAGTVDMEKVQVHPTGWVDPTDPTNPTKTLAAELMRGVGGVLINSSGERFCNELGTRAYVTDMMLAHNSHYAQTKKWDKGSPILSFSLVLSSSAAEDGKKHVDHYTHKGLLTRLEGLSALSEWMGVSKETLRKTFAEYQKSAKKGSDKWGKTSFRGVPQADLDSEIFYAGTVVPVLHYCMGGLTIDTEGCVLNTDHSPIPGLHAAGEVSGGVHGDNRLGGNSLLECTVFGSIVGQKLPIKPRSPISVSSRPTSEAEAKKKQLENLENNREVSMEELAKHNTQEDCWVAIDGVVYDMTDFAEEHPAGPQSIHVLAGNDGTEEFLAIHNAGILGDFEEERIGVLKSEPIEPVAGDGVSLEELSTHDDEDDAWVAFHGEVFDVTDFMKTHPGGSNLLLNVAGRDGTETFDGVHSKKKLTLIKGQKVGQLVQ